MMTLSIISPEKFLLIGAKLVQQEICLKKS
jgi:hypothetical protein